MIEMFKLLNIINLFNTVLPEGSGELISLLVYLGFFGLIALVAIFLYFTQGISIPVFLARVLRKNVAIRCLDPLRVDIKLFNRGVTAIECKDSKQVAHLFPVAPDSFGMLPNDCVYTIAHPTIGHTISLNQLSDSYTKGKEEILYSSAETASVALDIARGDRAR